VYIDSVNQLRELSRRRIRLQSRLAMYKSLSTLLEPIRDPTHNIQPNIVTRDGPLADELTRCRALAVRVGGRLGDWEGSSQQQRKDRITVDVGSREDQETAEDSMMHAQLNDNDKLQRLLDDWG
jgi:hypothetical protein